MTFKNQIATESELEKLGLEYEVIDNWTVDSERELYFYMSKNGRFYEDCEFLLHKFTLIMNSQPIVFHTEYYLNNHTENNMPPDTIVIEKIESTAPFDKELAIEYFKKAISLYHTTGDIENTPKEYNIVIKL